MAFHGMAYGESRVGKTEKGSRASLGREGKTRKKCKRRGT